MANVNISDLAVLSGVDRVTDLLEIYDTSASQNKKITINSALGFTGGSPVSTSDTQVLTNKTLGNTNTVTLKQSLFTLQDATDTTKQAVFVLSGITTGTTRSYTVPNASGTLVDLASAQTLTNKTLTSPTITTPTINNPTLNVDTISEFTLNNGTTVGGVKLKSGALATNNSVVTANITDSAVTPAKLVAGTGSGWAWSAWTPTWTNLTVGNGTYSYSKYIQMGKAVFARLALVLGSTSVIGTNPAFTLPVTSVDYAIGGSAQMRLGKGSIEDTGVTNYSADIIWATTTTANVAVLNSAGTYLTTVQVTVAVPAALGAGDSIGFEIFYEAV